MTATASTGLLYDERFLLHRAPYEHPEHPGRLTAIHGLLEAEGLAARCTPAAAARRRARSSRGSTPRRTSTRWPRPRRTNSPSSTPTPTPAATPRRPRGWRRRPRRSRARRRRRPARERPRAPAPAGPPRRGGPRDGVLPLQQRGCRGKGRAGCRRSEAGPHRRLGRAPRQRHAALLPGGSERPLLLDPPIPLLPGHRRGRRDRRGRRRGLHGERAPSGGLRRRRVPRRRSTASCCPSRATSRRTSCSSRRATTPPTATLLGSMRITPDGYARLTQRLLGPRRRPHRPRARGRLQPRRDRALRGREPPRASGSARRWEPRRAGGRIAAPGSRARHRADARARARDSGQVLARHLSGQLRAAQKRPALGSR